MEVLPISQLKLPKRMVQPDLVDKLKKSIDEIGLQQPIMIDFDNKVIDGLHRIKAIGSGHVECIRSSTRMPESSKYDTLSNEDYERVARRLCEISGIDPDTWEDVVRLVKLNKTLEEIKNVVRSCESFPKTS